MRVTFRHSAILFLMIGLTGCASYKPLPLAHEPNLAPSLAGLRVALPAVDAGQQPRDIDIGKPLGIDDIGLLAVLNDPDLRSEPGRLGVAEAGLVQASLLPNPSASLSYAALLGGPGTTSAFTASLSQDIASLVTYRTHIASAQAHVDEVKAHLLWQEWQVAQKARVLALDIYWDEQSVTLQRHQLDLVTRENALVLKAVSAGNLDLKDLSPSLAAKASVEQSLATRELAALKQWQALNALLGLAADARFAIAAPAPFQMPVDVDLLISSLPERRPDLVALQLGYRSADQDVRAAILGQFPAFTLGGSGGSDTSAVRSAGPTFTFDVPIFNRNQGGIAKTSATRLLLQEQYQARLDGAAGSVRGLVAQVKRLTTYLAGAREAAAVAKAQAATARTAIGQGSIDQRTLIEYETISFEREMKVVELKKSLGEGGIALTMELGLGLPKTRIVSVEQGESL